MPIQVIKWIEPAVYPLGMLWMVFLAGTLVFLFKRKWWKALACAAVTGAMALIGSTKCPYKLLATLERPYLRPDFEAIPRADALVMLGGTMARSTNDVFGFELGPAADRVLTAVELIRRKKASVLILGGGGGLADDPRWSEASALEAWFRAWELPVPELIRLDPSGNTHEEAVQVLKLAETHHWKRILLVTSGYHLRRSVGLFRSSEIAIEPVGCDFIGISESGYVPTIVPRLEGFEALEIYLHEVLGWYYYRSRGWIISGED